MEGREPRLAAYAQGWEGDLEHPDHPRAHERRHSRSLTCSDSAHFSQHKGFKLRQLKKKKKNPTLDLEERREGRGSVSGRGKSCHPTFPGGSSSRSWWRARASPGAPDGRLWGQSWQPPPTCQSTPGKDTPLPTLRIPSPRLHSLEDFSSFSPPCTLPPAQTLAI